MNKKDIIAKKIQYGCVPSDEDLLELCKDNHVLFHILCMTVKNQQKNYTYDDFARIAVYYLADSYQKLEDNFIKYMQCDTRPFIYEELK
jgi:hypothetical protein